MKLSLSSVNLKSLCSVLLAISVVACGSSSNPPSTVIPQQTTAPPPAAEVQLTLPIVDQNMLPNAVDPAQVIEEMGIGINLGNTLDAPIEGEWALEAQEYYIQAFQDAGFKHVRIPITWGNHIQEEAPYAIATAGSGVVDIGAHLCICVRCEDVRLRHKRLGLSQTQRWM